MHGYFLYIIIWSIVLRRNPNLKKIKDQISGKYPQPEPTGEGTPIGQLVIEDMQARIELGYERYNTFLKAFNGRDPLVDAYHEALDLVMYLRQAIEERDNPSE